MTRSGKDRVGNVLEAASRTDDEQSTGMGPVAYRRSNGYVIISMKRTSILHPPMLYTRHSSFAASICYS